MNYTKNYNHLTYDERAFIEIHNKYCIQIILRFINQEIKWKSALDFFWQQAY
ncbi:hypothetical protein R6878_000876 [Mycoplasmopsis bovis]|uniref:hypothetical protein n=1 Tax=Mycoplasmopsis bovis TaxID=28903 RepID=UPI003D801E03